MAPTTRMSRREAPTINRKAPAIDYNNYNTGDDSSSDESIPAPMPSSHRSGPNEVPTLRPKHPISPSVRRKAVLREKGRLSTKRVADSSPPIAERHIKRQRRNPSGTATNGGSRADKDVMRGAKGVNQAALDAINAFNRKSRGVEPFQGSDIEVRIPSTRSRSGLESDWDPEQQLQRETAAHQELRRAATRGVAQSGGNGYSVESSHGDVDRRGHVPSEETKDPDQVSNVADPDFEMDGDESSELDASSEGREEQAVESKVDSPPGYEAIYDAGSPELSSTSPYMSAGQAESRPIGPLPGVHMTKKLAQAPKIGSQGTLPTAGLEKAQRKSKPRVVKPAYGERPPSDKVAGRMSGTQENAPRSRRSKQAQDPPRQAFEPVSGRTATSAHLPADRSGREHLSSIARAAKPSPVPDTQRAVQALMDDYGQFSDEESLRPVPRRNPLSTQEPTAGESSLTVTLKSKLVRRMRRLLGGRGWTGLGWDWPFELSDPKLYGKPAGTMPHNAPPRTKLGRGCWKFLIYLQSLFEDAPRAGDLTEQNKWLSEKSSQIDKTFKSIDTMVRKISEEYLAVVGDSDNLINDNMELRLAMVKDLMEYIIPMLVSVLQTIFFLGGADTDEDFKPAFREEGTFTDSTLGCLAKAVGWIFSLERALSEELKRRPLDPSSDEESSDGEGRREKKAKDGRQKAKANLRKRRLRLGAYVGEFRRNIATAYDSLDATATKEERRRQTTARQKELDETRLKEEKAEEEERQRRWQAMCQSTQRMRHAPNPLSEKWRKTEAFDAGTAAYRLASQKAASQTVARHNGSSQPTARPLTRVDREPPRPASGRWPPWREEDSLWVLTQLRSRERRPDLRVWADVLERDVEDVWQEVEVLKQSWRSLARERGVEVEPWARA